MESHGGVAWGKSRSGKNYEERKGKCRMIGAIIGDVVGSRFEFKNTNKKNFKFFHEECCFTDDSVMTLAVAESIMRCWEGRKSFTDLDTYAVGWLHRVGRRYPSCGYGGRFFKWMLGDVWVPYNSCGNGSAMRISAVGDIAKDVEEAKEIAYKLTCITHNHPECSIRKKTYE